MVNAACSGMMFRIVPPSHGADMDGGVRRIEPVLERAFGGQAAGFAGDPGDRLAGGLHRVDALATARWNGPAGRAP